MQKRNASLAEMTRRWDSRADSGMYFDQNDSASKQIGVPRVWVPQFRCVFHTHFLEADAATRFTIHDTSSAGTPTNAQMDQKDGVWKFVLASNSEAETYGPTLNNDNLLFDPSLGLVCEFGWTTAAAITTNQRLVIGLLTAVNTTFDSVTRHVWFRQEAAADILVESDDGTTDDDDNDTTVDLTAGAIKWGRIECASPSDVRFYLNGARQLSTTTFGVGTGRLQFAALLQKASGGSQPELHLDAVAIYQRI